jgi:hypothetical protein
MRTLKAVAALFVLVSASAGANEFLDAAKGMDDAPLEQSFWVCDFRAIQGSLPGSLVPACQAVTDEFRRRKFADDFDKFVAWWQQHKAAAHGKLEAQHGAVESNQRPAGL